MAYNHYNISPLGHMNGMHPPPGEIPTGAGRGPRNLSTGYSGSTNQGQSFHQAVPDPQEPHGQDPQTNGQPALQGQTGQELLARGIPTQMPNPQEPGISSMVDSGPNWLLTRSQQDPPGALGLIAYCLHLAQKFLIHTSSQELIMNTDQPDSYGHLDSYGTEAGLRFAQRKLGISDTTYNKFKVLFKLKPEEQLPIIAMMIHDHHSSPKTVAAVAQAAKPEISTLKSAKNHAYPSNFKVVLLSPDIEQYGRTIPGRRHISQNPVFKIQRLINSQGKPFWHANLPAGYNKKKSEALTSVLLEIWKTVKNEKGYFLKLVGFL
ncbi:hypothetical protein PCANC_14271 [Puccinia coronata f. sp. avenae]|uniref:Uncharacterized protein n=1 Tax=Puccinia coronata f. sp. avenae TaxID=200324 RepID=A0A2N5SRS0_9BASI|nr:hypothetical protein PCANC_14271 [Puccinia coronata f. sp. avenae]